LSLREGKPPSARYIPPARRNDDSGPVSWLPVRRAGRRLLRV